MEGLFDAVDDIWDLYCKRLHISAIPRHTYGLTTRSWIQLQLTRCESFVKRLDSIGDNGYFFTRFQSWIQTILPLLIKIVKRDIEYDKAILTKYLNELQTYIN